MSDPVKHECGIAFIRLLKPLDFYLQKYQTPAFGLNKMYLLMEKQHNRGQDGAGLGVIKLDPEPGSFFINRYRSVKAQPILDIFSHVYGHFPKERLSFPGAEEEAAWHKNRNPFVGEVMLGHLRYGTYGKNSDSYCHPFLRENNWMTRNLMVAGNFNLTNTDQLFNHLIALGQHPREMSDTVTVMEKIGHFLDDEVQNLFERYKDQGLSNREITHNISEELNVVRILQRSARDFDGGFVMAGVFGHGDAFVLRDQHGIRPAFYYQDDEVVVVTSERPALQTAFKLKSEEINELMPGHALIVKKNGKVSETRILDPAPRTSCSFERIYFSRGTDKDIYQERKNLGYQLAGKVLEAIDFDLENTVFSFIPNTAELAFYGLLKGVEDYIDRQRLEKIRANPGMAGEELASLLAFRPRVEKVAVKDVKMRTFISDDATRDEMVSHVYDITYGSVISGKDTLVVVDDSIVRGTTLQKSILSILDRLGPKRIIIVSSAPQIRYPDCYGIDMSRMNDFIAFRAMISLIKSSSNEDRLRKVLQLCKASLNEPFPPNYVKELYDLFSPDEISERIGEIVRPDHMKADVRVIYQSIEGLHEACPEHTGDWYFTGNYPTSGGNRVANRSFVYYMEGNNSRPY